jgi:hypothetical protein
VRLMWSDSRYFSVFFKGYVGSDSKVDIVHVSRMEIVRGSIGFRNECSVEWGFQGRNSGLGRVRVR